MRMHRHDAQGRLHGEQVSAPLAYSSGVMKRSMALALALVALTACSTDGREMSPPSPDQTQSIALPTVAPTLENFDLSSTGVVDGVLDARHTCSGATTPAITFVGVAGDIVTLGVVMVDDQGTAVWAMANIAPTDTQIAENAVPAGAIRGVVTGGVLGYAAPCPSPGESRSYRLMGYALPQQVDLPDGVDADTLIELLESAALDVAVIDVVATGS